MAYFRVRIAVKDSEGELSIKVNSFNSEELEEGETTYSKYQGIKNKYLNEGYELVNISMKEISKEEYNETFWWN